MFLALTDHLQVEGLRLRGAVMDKLVHRRLTFLALTDHLHVEGLWPNGALMDKLVSARLQLPDWIFKSHQCSTMHAFLAHSPV
jgi:predicted metal-dependent phosphoesterase TrpH